MRMVLCGALVISACGKGEDTAEEWVPEEIGRCAAFDELRVPLFGDTHVHTRLSLDANLQGNRMQPSDAYRFAKGEEVGIHPHDAAGNSLRSVQLARPLDWAALSDHAEFMGLVTVCTTPGMAGYDDPVCARYRDEPDSSFLGLNILLTFDPDSVRQPPLCEEDGVDCAAAASSAWTTVTEAAEAAYDRTDACAFTSFVGYEWSSNPGSFNLHRNVIFRNERVPALPIGYLDEPHVEGLWDGLKAQCIQAETGCDVLTIPHNSNLSGGMMFEGLDRDGQPISASYAEDRARMEPLIEIFQHKGDSECWTGSPVGDEQCGFEFLQFNNLANAHLDVPRDPQPQDFVRDALGIGMQLEQTLGVNPYKYGIIASTDTHLGTPGLVDEATFPGHGGAGQSNRDALPVGLVDMVYFNPGGLAAVWAEENSREAVFQAMMRRETFGTSGPRITLRFFGGWDYDAAMCADGSFARTGYDGGVPMGGDLPAGTGAPTFALSALRDPGAGTEPGTQLQRVQIVKGWLDNGALAVTVYDVAGDGNNGATVDLATCETSGAGFDELCEVWTDPEFDPTTSAFYYARVLENPTCRWDARICADAAVDGSVPSTVTAGFEDCCDDRMENIQQERAWSAPIWYVPE